MIKSIFKTRIRTIPQFTEGQKIFTDILVTDNLSDDYGNLVSSLVHSKKVAFDELDVLPDSHDYTLEDLIKAGVTPKEVPTHGLLEDASFDINVAFGQFIDIVNNTNANQSNENVITENSEINN